MLFILCLGIIVTVGIKTVNAQTSPTDVTIRDDGSVYPPTTLIQQTGNIYTLTGNLDGAITVLRSNVILNGNGFALTAGGSGPGGVIVGCDYYSDSAPDLTGASNVTVENFIIKGGLLGISLMDTTDSLVFNNTISGTGVVDEQTAGVDVQNGYSNNITGNNLEGNIVGMSFTESENNSIVNNVIETSNTGVAFWVHQTQSFTTTTSLTISSSLLTAASTLLFQLTLGIVASLPEELFGDYYWTYSNASQIGTSGIGSPPYVIDAENKDNYPLIQPCNSTLYALRITPLKNIFYCAVRPDL